MRVLVACEFSGIVRDAFAARGHDAWSCDLLPSERGGKHFQADALDIASGGDGLAPWDLMIAHPPCTYLTVAGNKWFGEKYRDRFPNRHAQREDGVRFFIELALRPVPRICIENPIGVMSSRYRRPDQIIQPYEFGHPVRKTTALWLKNLPPLLAMREAHHVPELDRFPSGNTQSKWHTETGHIKDAGERAKARSRTFQGIADAMADQWGSLSAGRSAQPHD